VAFAPATAEAAGPPAVPAAWVTEVGTTSGRLNAEINPEGLATSYHFDYLTLAAYEANLKAAKEGFAGAIKVPAGADPNIGAGTTPLFPAQSISGLKAETAYRYRVVAKNSAGTTQGPEHTFITRFGSGPLVLLDNRGWEMVSPVDKNGGEVQGLGPGAGTSLLQAAPDGQAISYGSASSFGVEAGGAPAVSRYLSRRLAGSWSVENLSVPQLSGGYGEGPNADPYRLFSTDLAAALLSNGQRCRGAAGSCPVANPPLAGSGAPAGYRNYYLRQGGGFRALLTAAETGGLALAPEDFELAFAGAAPDLGHVVLSSCAALTPEATEVPGSGGECDPVATNLYEWSAPGGLALLNLLPGSDEGTPGAELAAPGGAVSADGSRVYWAVGGDLYLREGTQTKQVDGAPEVGGGGTFQTASANGAVAFFTKAGHLYRYDAPGETTTDLTPGGAVEGVLGASADGSRVYYLTGAGLFLRDGAVTTEVAADADPANYPPATGTARVSPDGSRLAFLSEASLTGYDNVGQASREPESQVFLFNATASGPAALACASCNPTLGRPLGASTLPGALGGGEGPDVVPAYKPRALSADGRRLFFDSADALVLQDTNNSPDVYEWEAQGAGTCVRAGGCVNLVSSGRSGGGASFADASAGGSDAFFLTDGPLVEGDPGSVDLYDAREGGGFTIPPKPIPCEGDACQPLPSPPDNPPIGTTGAGPGNSPVVFPKQAKQKAQKGKKKKGKGKRGKAKRNRRATAHRAKGAHR
jgi:WD40-like Beta Propeller Repeat